MYPIDNDPLHENVCVHSRNKKYALLIWNQEGCSLCSKNETE